MNELPEGLMHTTLGDDLRTFSGRTTVEMHELLERRTNLELTLLCNDMQRVIDGKFGVSGGHHHTADRALRAARYLLHHRNVHINGPPAKRRTNAQARFRRLALALR